ncbi:MAG: hypothetical protein ACW98Y_18560, partial [Candidatus Thorarchaeota archaeon]
LDIDVYNEPNDLIFPTGSDFKIVVRVNVTEPGTYFGNPLSGLLQGEFSVSGFAIKEWYNLGDGRYNFTIDESSFPEGTYTITLTVSTTSSSYSDDTLQITFSYRPALSEASSPDRAVVTPYETDFNVTITYTDIDRDTGITGASVTPEGITFYNELDLGNGDYQVTINVTDLAEGEHLYNLTIDKAGYDAGKLSFKIIIRIAYTYAIPTVGALDIPVGDDAVFYVEYWDIDHDLPIDDSFPFLATSTWIHSVTFTYIPGEERYRVDFPTNEDDPLVQSMVITFNFSKGENYQFGIFNISVTLRTHYTDFRLVSAIEPTSYNDNISISVFYGDLDSGTGIHSRDIAHRVWNGTQDVTSYLYNDTLLGGGYYTIIVPAPQFGGLGLQNFTIYFNWTGVVYTYQNSTIYTSANIIGEDSSLSLLVTAEPTPYLENMTYTLFFAAINGTGINNNTGNVFVSVTFTGYTVDLNEVDIWEIDPGTNRGQYTIQFNNSIFPTTGLIYMKVYFNWTKGVTPFYTNRTDTVSVRVLARDTLISIDPPSQTAYSENATLSFTFDDVTGALAESIANDAALSFVLNLSDYSYTYDSPSRTFTISFNTSQFGAIGLQSFHLNITWTGAPFYANQTGKSISVTITQRQTTLDYQSPAPTQYLDNATFSVFWTDVAGASSFGITGATLTLYDGVSPIDSQFYTVVEIGSGEYEVELSTEYKATPGQYTVTVEITAGVFYYPTDTSDRLFTIRYRSTLVSSDPFDLVPYNSSIEINLYFQDLITLVDVDNDTFDVTLELLTAGNWIVTSQWQGANGYYVITVETYNQVGLQIGVQYPLHFNLSYADQSPFYNWDDITVYFELRYRDSSLERTVAPIQTPYLDYVNFTVYYSDADASAAIDGATINLLDGGTPLSLGTDYIYSSLGSGLYAISVDSTVLGGLGSTPITVWANWTTGSPHYDNATLTLDLVVIERATDVVFVVSPTQTSYLENVTFVVSFRDLALSSLVSATKNLVNVYNGGTQLLAAEFTFNEIGATQTYEISINSTILTAILATDLNITVQIDWPSSPNYYQDDVSSTRVTIRARDTFVSLQRPANTAFGENATFTFTFLDTTNSPEQEIADDANLILITNLTENPSLSYNSGSRIFTISFNTSQFGATGQFEFHLNVTWNGAPFYTNQTLQSVLITVVLRQTQVDFQAPAPTPYGDSVTFTVWYLDIAGVTDTGITDGTLTMYYSGNAILPPNVTITPLGDGSFEVVLDTDFFPEPGTYSLNASFVYTGGNYAADAFAIRPISVRLRTTVLSTDPVGAIGYGTIMDITIYFQDQLTLADIANSSTTYFEILNTTNPFSFTVSWNGALSIYELAVDTAGHTELIVGNTYVLHLNMSYVYQDPFYRWDDVYVEFTIRARTATLDIFESAQPAPYLEYSTFIVYYWDVDVGGGIGAGAIFTIENETHTLAG